ncbi:MAG: MFS transporter [Oryzihumus sp.]
MSTLRLGEPRTAALPRSFMLWLGAATLSTWGDSVAYFALGWAATGIGPQWGGVVLTTVLLPRTALLLVGGAMGDRWGARRVMVVGDAVMCLATAALTLLVHLGGVHAWLLVGAGLTIGVVDAFYLPATGTFPRLFVDDADLPRALALTASASQLVRLGAGPAGGLLVALAGLSGAAVVDAISFAVVLAVLVVIRPRHEAPPSPAAGPLWHQVADGLQLVWRSPSLRTALATVSLVASFLLPVASLCIPLLARTHGWSAVSGGLLVGATVAGALSVTVLVARRGASGQPMLVAGAGLLVAGCGTLAVAWSPWLGTAVVGALVQGVGTALFTTRVGPILLGSAPRTHLARVHSLRVLVQAATLVVALPLLRSLAAWAGAVAATTTCAVGTAAAGVVLLRQRRLVC